MKSKKVRQVIDDDDCASNTIVDEGTATDATCKPCYLGCPQVNKSSTCLMSNHNGDHPKDTNARYNKTQLSTIKISLQSNGLVDTPSSKIAKEGNTKSKQKQEMSLGWEKDVSLESKNVNRTSASGSAATLVAVTIKRHQCQLCSKFFKTSCNLKMHIRTHTGERPYSCEFCSSSFTRQESLNTHIRTHTGERPYPCQLCPKSFKQLGHLKTHTNSHTGERPFVCNLCPKAFTQQGHLNRHIRTHTV